MFNMLIHCKSLGDTPHIRNVHNSFAVELDVTPIEHIWAWTAECAKRNGGINNLLIACHAGYVGNEKKEEGGWGLNLGTRVDLTNVGLMKVLTGRANNIYIFACGAAKEPDFNKLTDDEKKQIDFFRRFDNRLMVKRMAEYTRCNVYASANKQKFKHHDRWYKGLDFGAWEGKVEKFTPQGDIFDVTSRMHDFGKETGNE